MACLLLLVFATGLVREDGHQSTRTTPTMNKSSALVFAPMVAVVLLLQVLGASAAPIRYDQRQDGDSNIDARLQNFFVVLAPTNTAQLGSTGINLLDLASKAVPLRLRPQVASAADALKQREEPDQPQGEQEVKESKTGRAVQAVPAPLAAVAIPAAILSSPLAKLHPEMQALQAIGVEEVLIARSPVVALRSPPAPGPLPASGAVPMLVAVPVPEVAPERPASPPALLPMHPAGATTPLGDKPAPAAAPVDAAAIVDNAAPVEPEAIAAPEAVVDTIRSAEAETAPVESTPVEAAPAPAAAPVEALPPAVETNQVEPEVPKQEVEIPDIADLAQDVPKVHLIGTGIEECGPERVRNQEGICVDAAPRD